MKILVSQSRREAGVAVIIVIAILSIVLIYVAVNIRTIDRLGNELKLVEKQQIRRTETRASAVDFASPPSPSAVETNTPVATP